MARGFRGGGKPRKCPGKKKLREKAHVDLRVLSISTETEKRSREEGRIGEGGSGNRRRDEAFGIVGTRSKKKYRSH